MNPLTIGDIRPFLTFVSSSPALDQNATIASQIRGIYTSLGVPVTPELDTAFTTIENNPSLVGVGVAEFRAAVDGLPDDTLLTDVPAFAGTGGGQTPIPDPIKQPDGPVAPGTPVVVVPMTDPDGNLVQTYTLPFSGATISVANGVVTVTTPTGTQQLNAVDRLTFDNGTVYFDVDEEPGSVYQAYKGLFGSTPDKAGFEFWVDALESDAIDAFDLAGNFVSSQAFTDIYGSLISDSNALVEAFYQNLLGRAGDAAGLAFWSDFIDTAAGNAGVTDTVGYFLTSDELDTVNQTAFADGLFV